MQPVLIFSSSVLNPRGRFYQVLKRTTEEDYEDNYWLEDAIFMERNSRDFVSRVERINMNAEAICSVLKASPLGKIHTSRGEDFALSVQAVVAESRSIGRDVTINVS